MFASPVSQSFFRTWVALLTLISSLAIAPVGSADAGEIGLLHGPFEIRRLDHGLYYGSAPKSDEDFARLRALGVRHVIDIRTFKVVASGIESHRAARFGMQYQRIPTGFFPTKRDTVPKVMQRLAQKPCGPVFFHCNLGSDRTGLLVALYRVRYLGWDPHVAFAEWKAEQFNTRLEDLDRYYWSAVSPVSPVSPFARSGTRQEFR